MGDNAYGNFVRDYPLMIWMAFAVSICTMCAVLCSKTVARRVPLNYIILFIFTLAESYMVGFITTLYDPELVLKAAFITLIITLSLTAYALTTSHDFTYCGGSIWIFSSVFLTFMLF